MGGSGSRRSGSSAGHHGERPGRGQRLGSAAAQVFGPLRVLPGRAVRLPFEQVGEFGFACSTHPRGQLIVQVVAPPDPGFARLRWRVARLLDALRYLPAIAPFPS